MVYYQYTHGPKNKKRVNALIPPHESAIRKKSAQKLTSWSGPQMHPQHNMQLPMQGMGDMHLFYTK
jgi:hypothetical protein